MKFVGPVACVAVLYAASNASVACAQNAPRIAAGDSQINGALLPLRSDTVRNVFIRDGVERSEGWVLQRLVQADANGEPGLLFIIVGEMDRQTDSILVVRNTLRPLWHRWHSPGVAGAIEYRGTRITGHVQPKDSTARLIQVETPVPAYDGETVGLIRAALPLTDGFSAGIPVFDWNGGFSWRDVTVSAPESFGGRTARRVTSVTAARDQIEVFIDVPTRATLLGRINFASGARVEMRRRF